VDDDGLLLPIGELARRSGLPVRTIRFWSDIGVLPPAERTEGGRRLYDAACVARLELIVTLRELGLGLPEVRRVLAGQATVAEVAAVHLEALDAQIRTLRLHRGVLAAVVKRAADGKEIAMINTLARLSVAERRQIIDDFTAEVFAGLDPSPARFARWSGGPDLPGDPSPEQVEAWIELAGLAGEPDFRQRVRQVVEIGMVILAGRWLVDDRRAQEAAGEALRRGIRPGSPEGAQVLEAILAGTAGSQQRGTLLAQLEVVTDPRIERYWQLTAVITGKGPFSSQTQPALKWLADALRAQLEQGR
jgi:DNA-binding transcriptional MerR regulator